jgi:hypothetical protein
VSRESGRRPGCTGITFLDDTGILKVNDRVSVPGGRVGHVIGYYHRDPETVLVGFDAGGSAEYIPADLHLAFMRHLAPPAALN